MEESVFMRPGGLYKCGVLNRHDLASVLPIDYINGYIKSSFKNSEVDPIMLVKAPTGVGKTTDFVTLMMKSHHKSCLVFVPKISAADGVSKYITSDKYKRATNLILGKNVGKMTGPSSVHPTEEPNIMFATWQLMDKLLPKALDEDKIVFIDEMHDVQSCTSLTAAFQDIIYHRRNRYGTSFCILMSATPNTSYVKHYFGLGPNASNVVEMMPQTLYPIIPIKQKLIRARDVPGEIERIMDEERFSRAVAFVFTCDLTRKEKIGKYSVVHVRRSELEKNPDLISQNTSENVVFLCTQVAETGITFNMVDAVFDDCTTRTMIRGPVLGLGMLILTQASKATVIQRKGRAGRTMKGSNIAFDVEEARNLHKLPQDVDETRITYEYDTAGAIVLAPELYDLIRMCGHSDTLMYQTPLAGNFEPLMTKAYKMGLIYMSQEELSTVSSVCGKMRIGMEALMMLILLIDCNVSYDFATMTIAYFSVASESSNKLINHISVFEIVNGQMFRSDLGYLYALLTNEEFYFLFCNIIGSGVESLECFLDKVMMAQAKMRFQLDTYLPSLQNVVGTVESDNAGFEGFMGMYCPQNNMAIKCDEAKGGYDLSNVCHAKCKLRYNTFVYYTGTLKIFQSSYEFVPIMYLTPSDSVSLKS